MTRGRGSAGAQYEIKKKDRLVGARTLPLKGKRRKQYQASSRGQTRTIREESTSIADKPLYNLMSGQDLNDVAMPYLNFGPLPDLNVADIQH